MNWLHVGFRVGCMIALQLLLGAGGAGADLYFNSSEPGCDGSDPTMLWCDDFEDGYWWSHLQAGPTHGESYAPNDGWYGYCGQYSDGVCVTQVDTYGDGDHALCGGFGAAGTDCAGHKGHTGVSMSFGWKRFPREVRELYLRFYWMFSGVTFLEKIVGLGDMQYFGGHNSDYGFLDTHFGNNFLYWTAGGLLPGDLINNAGGNLIMSSDRWYYVEIHIKLNTPGASDGVYELWSDDCGANGLGCTGPGTLRARHTNVRFEEAGLDGIGWVSLWGWANPTSGNNGLRRFDQIVARTQRIGPMAVGGGVQPPAAPIQLD